MYFNHFIFEQINKGNRGGFNRGGSTNINNNNAGGDGFGGSTFNNNNVQGKYHCLILISYFK